MANEILTSQAHGLTCYAVLVNTTGQYFRTDSLVFESFTAANWAHYTLTLAENSTTGVFIGSMPAVAAGTYRLAVYIQAGGSPAVTDVCADSLSVDWSGTAIANSSQVTVAGYASGQDPATLVLATPANKLATNSSGQVQQDLTQAVPLTNTAQTVGDALNAARAQGFGKWVLSGTKITLYGPDGTTAVHTFTLDNSANPTTRS